MTLLTELERDRVVQEMCRNGAYTGAAEFIETWVFSEQEHQALLEEARTLANYSEVDVQKTADMHTDLFGMFVTEEIIKQGDTAEVISKKEKPKSMGEALRNRMEDEFGKDLWNG